VPFFHPDASRQLRATALAGALGFTGVGLIRSGGFYTPDLVAIPLFIAVAALMVSRPVARPDARVMVTLGIFAGVWLLRGAVEGTAARAASLSSAAVAFGVTFLLARRCRAERERALVTRALVVIALVVALLSLFGWASDRFPWGIPYDGFWRLSGPFAYPNAAGLFFALAIVLALVQHDRSWFDRLGTVAILFGALAATASRGAVVALVGGLVILGYARAKRERSISRTAAAAGIGIGSALILYVALISAGVIGETRAGNATASIDDRTAEARSAFAQGRAQPLVGSGPERELVIHNFRGLAVARFAHNEPLQVWAGAGLIGLVPLLAIAVALVAVYRDDDRPRGSLAVVAASMLVIGGLLDFSWHFVGLVAFAGWLCGLDEALTS
jgi:O-antigen ligase